MTRIVCFVVFVVLHAIIQTRGQEFCVPSFVEDIVLYDDHILTWNPPLDETCPIDHYLISVTSESNWEERIFLTDQTILDVGYLLKCETVRIFVTPVSPDSVEGIRSLLYTKTSAPPEVNLDLTFFRLSPYTQGVVNLEWDVAAEWKKCVKEYRVVGYNEDDDDVFITNYVPYAFAYISNIAPCTSYVFTATALHSLEEEGQVSVIRYTTPSEKIDAPSLQRITPGSTTVDLTWTFPGPSVNRCPVNALVVDASPYFNVSYPIPSQNQVSRPPMNVRLTGLQPDTMYLLHVSANNSAGFSEPVIVGVQTLES